MKGSCRVVENEKKEKNKELETPENRVNTLTPRIGACRFCGQITQVEVEGSQEEMNVEATEKCNCCEAEEYRKQRKQAEKADANIRDLFSEEYPETAKILKASIEYLQKHAITSVSIDTGRGVKAKIAMNNKGKIKVEATSTQKTSREE
jgi:hypothetical protein